MTFTTPINTNEQSIDRVLGAGLPVLLIFWRKQSAPSEQIEPALQQLAAAYAGKVLLAKVDVQDNPALVRRYNVTQLPELIFLNKSAEVARAQGAAGEPDLRAWLERLLAGDSRPASPRGPSMPLSNSTPGGSAAQQHSNGHRPQANGTQPDRGGGSTRASEQSPGKPVTLTDATFDQVIGQGDAPVLVDFWAPWCGPCRAVAPTVERLAQEFAGRAVVAKLNVDDNPRTAQRFGITGIPALYIFKRGQVAERLVGAQPAPALRQALARHVG
jgi:thioredoxin 1